LQVAAGPPTRRRRSGRRWSARLNIMQFCKDFNAASADMEKGSPVPVVLTIYATAPSPSR
jgi:large subunit ribosomal protein L11